LSFDSAGRSESNATFVLGSPPSANRARRLGWFLPFPSHTARPSFLAGPVAAFRAADYIQDMDTITDTHKATFDELLEDFELLEDWEDRYRYVIELGRKLKPLPEAERNAQNKVEGCVSQVWLSTTVHRDGTPRLTFIGDSDAHIVRGLIAILFAIYSGKTADEILDVDAPKTLGELHLKEHLTPQRSNGLMAMVKRIQSDAEAARAAAH